MIYKWDKYDAVAAVLAMTSWLGLLLYRYEFDILGGVLMLVSVFCMFPNVIIAYKERGKLSAKLKEKEIGK